VSVQWTPSFQSTLGLRSDTYWFRVRSNIPENSGDASHSIVSPKLGLTFTPWSRTALFLNGGTGFHSNDARGATITVDPATGDAAERVTPLARATGAEAGLRSIAVPGLETTLALWGLDIESELVFIGDAGVTEPSRPSRRTGFELTGVHRFGGWASVDASLAWSRARFRDDDPAGDRIPGAVEGVVSAGVSILDRNRFFGALRARYFGPRPLIEDNSVRSRPATLLGAEMGYRLGESVMLSIEGFNLLDAEASDVDYYYESRLPGEPDAGISDIHTHPEPPRTFRLQISASLPQRDRVPPQNGHPRERGDR
jgi:outer membrane receptor protein involved in Fe transport